MVQATYTVQGMLAMQQAFTNMGLWAKSKINATTDDLPACSRHGAISWGPWSSSRWAFPWEVLLRMDKIQMVSAIGS